MSAANFTFHNFREVLFDQMTVRQALFNTFQYAIITATICTFLGFAVAYISQRKLLPYSHLLASITLAPFAVPGIVLAICFYAAYAPPPFALYGLGALVVIAFVTRFLPIAFTNSNSAIQGLHPELEEAVRIAGGNQARALWLVVLPILKKSLFGSWLLIFIIGTRELSTAMFLSGPQTRVVSVLTLELSEQGSIRNAFRDLRPAARRHRRRDPGRRSRSRPRLHAEAKLMDKLQLKGLTKKFADLVVVDDLNLTLARGRIRLAARARPAAARPRRCE